MVSTVVACSIEVLVHTSQFHFNCFSVRVGPMTFLLTCIALPWKRIENQFSFDNQVTLLTPFCLHNFPITCSRCSSSRSSPLTDSSIVSIRICLLDAAQINLTNFCLGLAKCMFNGCQLFRQVRWKLSFRFPSFFLSSTLACRWFGWYFLVRNFITFQAFPQATRLSLP